MTSRQNDNRKIKEKKGKDEILKGSLLKLAIFEI
jgi:hypothetical protein